ncbi:MAG TPA: hypothetical protein VMU94_00080 [Streptosporangiaceae bacterium]|nr:hypothetical protein [Streptosporangiaceae bacterium]
MSAVEMRDGQFNDRVRVISAEVPEALAPVTAGAAERGLVLPDGVVADLAGQLVARARAGEPVALTGRDGLLSGLIGQVLQRRAPARRAGSTRTAAVTPRGS